MGNHGLRRYLTGTASVVLGLALVGSRIEPSGGTGSGSFAADGGAGAGAVAMTAVDTPFQSTVATRDAGAGAVEAPQLPRASVDTTEVAVSGRVIHVAAGADLQAAIDKAQPGDRITLDRGATYRGPFRLPRKEGNGWIVISTNDKGLAGSSGRVSPSQASAMPKLVASTGSVVETDPAAHHYRLVGLEIAPTDGVYLRALMQIGAEEGPAEALPHHIIVDRCYLHGDPRRGARRGVALNSRESAVINSYLSDFKEVGADSQAIVGWNGPGPFRIANNYLEAAGENVMFGGADPTIDGLVPPTSRSSAITWPSRSIGASKASELSGHGVERQEPVRAEKCPPGAGRRQLVRIQLAALPERVCDSVYLREPGWPIAVVGRRRHHVRQQPRAACGGRHQRAGPRRHSLQPADAPDRDPEQSVPGRRRQLGIGPSLPAAGRHQRRLDRSQYGAADRHAGLLRRSRAAHATLSFRTTSHFTISTGSSGREPARAGRRSIGIFRARCSAAT